MILRHCQSGRSVCAFVQVFARPDARCTRGLHQQSRVPSPTPFVPDVPTFLKLIGRNSSQHAGKFPSWEALFSFSSPQLRKLGLEPARARRYLLRWREKFRRGIYGVGGDLTEVVDGTAEVRIVEVPVPVPVPSAAGAGAGADAGAGAAAAAAATAPRSARSVLATGTATLSPGMRKMIVNVRPGMKVPPVPLDQARPVKQMTIGSGHVICGPYVRHVEGTHGMVARLTAQEGMWEDRRGRKIDGGERRRAEVRFKRRTRDKS